jgi:hypothetical protein
MDAKSRQSLGVVLAAGVTATLCHVVPAQAQSTSVTELQTQIDSNTMVAQTGVTSVSQLSDVRPTDWAFTALQSLVERYGCIAGYPDRTFRGQRALSRFEFAAGLNACLDKINEIITAGLADKVSAEDLAALQRLQEEFAAELATLRGRVDALEARTSRLEAQQFSTTTKLGGEVIMAGTGATAGSLGNSNIFLATRVRLDFNTSFTGSDLLKTRIELGGGGGSVQGLFGVNPAGNVGNVGFATFGQDYAGLGTGAVLAKLRYDFNVGKDVRVSIGPVMHAYDHIDTNSFANNEAVDFSSTFFINNPLQILINPQTGGSGAFLDWNPGGGAFSLRGLYLAANAGNANAGANIVGVPTNRGLFGDPYQASVELEFSPKTADGDKGPFAIKLQYTNGGVSNATLNTGGVNLEWQFAKGVALFGRYGFGTIDARGQTIGLNPFFGGFPINVASLGSNDLSPQTWMFGFAFPDLFKDGALAAIAIGQPFIESKVGNSTQTNLELFYSFPVSDNITITPDIQFIFNPNNTSGDTIFVGTLRTVFSF